jgi:glucose-6-phosphate isomerase
MLSLKTKFYGEELKDSAEALLSDAEAKLAELVSKKCTGSEFTGWFNWPKEKGFKLNKSIEEYISSYTEAYDTVVVVGIGGSYLGTKSIADALSHRYSEALSAMGSGNKKNIFFAGHNLSESELIELVEILDHKQPIVNIISKSGTTTEPGVAFRVLKDYMEKRYGNAASDRIIATTDAKRGALRVLSEKEGYKTFEVPDDVGGRFSVLTAVGLLPLRLAGYSSSDLLDGADEFFESILKGVNNNSLSSEPASDALNYAAHRMAAWNAGNRVEILSYGEAKMNGIIEWWKQLFGESEGKSGKGLFPVGLSCTTDLHSLGQYIQEGVRNQLETFLYVENATSNSGNGVEKRLRVPSGSSSDGLDYLEGTFVSEINNAALLATEIAHFDGGVPCLELHLKNISEKSLGYLIAFFETSCAVSALMLGVNPFDQPGVEAYKKNLFGIMGRPNYEEIGEALNQRIK